MQTFVYATPVEAATAAGELLSRARSGTVTQDMPLLVNQVHGVVGFGCGLTFGKPGDVTPVVPIGMSPPCDLDDAQARLELVKNTGGIPSTGSLSWLTVAIRAALLKAIENVPEPMKTLMTEWINKVF